MPVKKAESRRQKAEGRSRRQKATCEHFCFLLSAFCFLHEDSRALACACNGCFARNEGAHAAGFPRNHFLIRSQRDGGFGGGSVVAGCSTRRFEAVTVTFFVARDDSSIACCATARSWRATLLVG